MILKPGEKIHAIKQRMFESEVRRHFIGEVTEATEQVARVKGYAFVFDTRKNQYLRHTEERERLISIIDSSILINILPSTANVERVRYVLNRENMLCVTDGEAFSMNINEFGATH